MEHHVSFDGVRSGDPTCDYLVRLMPTGQTANLLIEILVEIPGACGGGIMVSKVTLLQNGLGFDASLFQFIFREILIH